MLFYTTIFHTMEECSPRPTFHIRIAQWPVHWAQMVFLLGILPHLSSNFIGFDETSLFDITLWAGLGCVFVDLPLPRYAIPGCPSEDSHRSSAMSWSAMPLGIPCLRPSPTVLRTMSSHLCESFWRQYITKNGLNIVDYFLPPSRCVNPLHLTVEKHRNNLARERCLCNDGPFGTSKRRICFWLPWHVVN